MTLFGKEITTKGLELIRKDPQSVEKLENGKVNPTLYTLSEVANALGISVSKLVNL